MGSRLKAMVVRGVAILIAVGILGGGGYLGAQYLGLFDPEVEPRLRYMPDNPDFFMTVNVPKVMAIAQNSGADMSAFNQGVSYSGMPFDPTSVQDVTFAGNVHEKRWVLIATLGKPLELEKLFGANGPSDTTRAGGTKIYYDRQMATYGMDFAVAMPSKTILLVGPVDTLKSVLKRRGAPRVSKAFEPLLTTTDSNTWAAGAADVDALWRMLSHKLPTTLPEEQRWLLESIDTGTFAMKGGETIDFEGVLRCKNAKDAPLIVEKAKVAFEEQRKQLMELFVGLNQPVNADTLKIFEMPEISTDGSGAITLRQKITRDMLDESAKLLTLSGVIPQP